MVDPRRRAAARAHATSEALVPAAARCRAQLLLEEPGIVCGVPVAAAVFRALHETVHVEPSLPEGSAVTAPPAVLATIDGPARAVLTGERVALNLASRLCGIASLTRRYVDLVEGTGATILDTRKTTPGLRALERYAVRCGGGTNHRDGLYDAILIKENHSALAGGVVAAVERARAARPDLPITVEVRLWGGMVAGSRDEPALAADAEGRLESFTELVATTIANADSRAGVSRLAADQAALWENLEVIDCFATDHAPHTLAEKDGEDPPPGYPGLETAMALFFTAVQEGRLTLENLLARMVTNPRRIFHLPEQPETWIEVEPQACWEISAAQTYARCGGTPFEGRKVHGRVRRVVLRGREAYRDGLVLAPPGFGRNLRG